MMSDFITINTITVPELFGPLRGANGNARITGPCGDTMEFWIRVENDIITAAHYTTDGCYYSNKCGTTTAIMATEVPLSVAGQFTQSDILAVAGDIEQASEHCALLAAIPSKLPSPTTGGNSTGQPLRRQSRSARTVRTQSQAAPACFLPRNRRP